MHYEALVTLSVVVNIGNEMVLAGFRESQFITL